MAKKFKEFGPITTPVPPPVPAATLRAAQTSAAREIRANVAARDARNAAAEEQGAKANAARKVLRGDG